MKGNRLSDLSPCKLEEFYDFVDAHKDDKDIISLIRSNFGINYSSTSIRYIRLLCGRRDEQRRLERDNQLMDRWNSSKPQNSYNYADLLSDLANNKIDSSEFERLLQ